MVFREMVRFIRNQINLRSSSGWFTRLPRAPATPDALISSLRSQNEDNSRKGSRWIEHREGLAFREVDRQSSRVLEDVRCPEGTEWSRQMRQAALEMEGSLVPLDPKMVKIYKDLATDDAYLKIKAWRKFDEDQLIEIAVTSLRSLVVLGDLDAEVAADIKMHAGFMLFYEDLSSGQDEELQAEYEVVRARVRAFRGDV